jgi:RNA polymerase-binding transcription factor DksA
MADLLVDTGHALEEHHRAELADVGAALRRLAAGTYGRCTDCGSGVDYERLRSCPTATRCTPCQQQHERTFAGALRPSL